jgi:hypothetical protein
MGLYRKEILAFTHKNDLWLSIGGVAILSGYVVSKIMAHRLETGPSYINHLYLAACFG